MGRILQRLYDICGAIAGGLTLCICLLVSAQILLNAAGRLGFDQLPSTIPSYADFSGFMLAASTFLALAHTLRAGGHIRVNLVAARLPHRAQVAMEALVRYSYNSRIKDITDLNVEVDIPDSNITMNYYIDGKVK